MSGDDLQTDVRGEVRSYDGTATSTTHGVRRHRGTLESRAPTAPQTVAAGTGRGQERLLSAAELDRLERLALAALERIDAQLRHGLDGTPREQRFQWAILKALVGDTESAYRLLRGSTYADDPRFPVEAVKAVLNLGA